MAQISLYYQTQLENKVSLLPDQMDSEMDEHLLRNLESKVKGKVTKDGIVLKINRLISYEPGIIPKSNFASTAVYDVKFECLVCSPTINLTIICVVENIIKGYLIAKNGPVTVIIMYNNINNDKFTIVSGNVVYNNNKTAIQKGDYIKVSVVNINSSIDENKILTMCKLIDFATKEEISSFDNDQALIMGDDNNTQEFI
ncbi:putative DNA-directed RNA polymerase subunit [Acanthamoeba polyphaga moumouvirus]|uniref:Putative DNA-directed RNA polymerase subunit n=2 Tax=Moumouvirus TaxID=3080801 RepID=L7RCL4_9VIRU|nr:putative DNA-directed RNA polymerase subunit [Acanthamoeba polyphaga moumouvirus]AEX62752.1 putative DNA-directed RNA polymerase subunit [Moumouvirus Monve]AGC01981.1 putative DNA-directed RNA polymerase subunit [Acanthamoeba polyphaga moumouvirus]AQN68348.1 putative DNA-directed RNA polymerase subunit [Saudi moumouvirus]